MGIPEPRRGHIGTATGRRPGGGWCLHLPHPARRHGTPLVYHQWQKLTTLFIGGISPGVTDDCMEKILKGSDQLFNFFGGQMNAIIYRYLSTSQVVDDFPIEGMRF
ncbi:uncharacterized protein OCT59_008563 [Rhizophagus irregularis]|uniref:uncharacterized protein n=1 Tax=Rhizophagus irregularis TaxID=588596 RepID=UPI000CBD8035|nr:hypothetical protein OCT59_008563 [Rhizophagus irregularis]